MNLSNRQRELLAKLLKGRCISETKDHVSLLNFETGDQKYVSRIDFEALKIKKLIKVTDKVKGLKFWELSEIGIQLLIK